MIDRFGTIGPESRFRRADITTIPTYYTSAAAHPISGYTPQIVASYTSKIIPVVRGATPTIDRTTQVAAFLRYSLTPGQSLRCSRILRVRAVGIRDDELRLDEFVNRIVIPAIFRARKAGP